MKPEIENLIEILVSLRRTQHFDAEDGFYSCPAHPEYFGTDISKECNCGFNTTNKKIDEAIIIAQRLQESVL